MKPKYFLIVTFPDDREAFLHNTYHIAALNETFIKKALDHKEGVNVVIIPLEEKLDIYQESELIEKYLKKGGNNA